MLRDPLSVAAPIFGENITGLGLMKGYADALAKAKLLKKEGKQKQLETHAKLFSEASKADWDYDAVNKIYPKMDEAKRLYSKYAAETGGDLDWKQWSEINNLVNTAKEEAIVSNKQHTLWNANNAILVKDHDELDYDHEKSITRQKALYKPTEFFNNPANKSKIDADPELLEAWETSGKDDFMFRESIDGLVPGEPPMIDLLKDINSKKTVIAPPTKIGWENPSGEFIYGGTTKSNTKEERIAGLKNNYDTGTDSKGRLLSKTVDRSWKSLVTSGDVNAVKYSNAKDWYANTFEPNVKVEEDISTVQHFGSGGGSGSAANKTVLTPYTKDFNIKVKVGKNLEDYTISGDNTLSFSNFPTNSTFNIHRKYDFETGQFVDKPIGGITGTITDITQVKVADKKIPVAVITYTNEDEDKETMFVDLKDVKQQVIAYMKQKKIDEDSEFDISAYPDLAGIVTEKPQKEVSKTSDYVATKVINGITYGKKADGKWYKIK